MSEAARTRASSVPGASSGFYRRSLDSASPPHCNKCPSCVQIRHINEYSSHEATPLLASSTPLLRDSRCCDKSLIALFVCLLLFGSGIATYLLYIESRAAVIEEFDYISRESWSASNNSAFDDLPPLHTPVSKVMLLELFSNCTGLKHCLNYEKFTENNRDKIRIFDGQVLYNFYQDQSGTIFEGRGWGSASDCPLQGGCQNVVAIGVIEKGNVRKLKAFLDYGISVDALTACYDVTFSEFPGDLAYALKKMIRKDGPCKYYS